MSNQPQYRCAICDQEYDTIAKRTNCEQACLKKQAEEEKRAAAEKKKAEQKIRKEAVDEAVATAVRLMASYMQDYGSYEYDENNGGIPMWPSKIWHYFG